MIAKLSGRIDAAGADHLVIDVGGVGYLVHASARTISTLGAVGETASVHTEMQVSENDLRLIGFAGAAERDWFRLLIGVQGVGSKVALAILSALELEELKRACGAEDAAMVARANGVGPKLAKRIVTELRDKAGAVPGGNGGAPLPAGSNSADAVSALQNLGFKPAEAGAAVAAAAGDLGDDAGLDALVRMALKKAAK
ncbi:Holliday junction branch migration protein RuvA [Novosphingopyxis sp.]|uniref:Holliday junction branch migration protein RuvA n=1 Tax=Novosphingopyxis sp. TaxID=2709690 RepID=UPI003B59E923